MPKKILIIGAGIAGLSAGCYARMNGYEAEIYEMHDKPGGLCTSWKRRGYTFDGCLHWLTGSSPADNLYKIWQELGAVQGRRMYDPEVFFRYHRKDGRTLTLYTDVNKLEAHLKELSPADAIVINLFCHFIRRFSAFQMPIGKPYELYNFADGMSMVFKMAPYARDFKYCINTTIGQFAKRFKDPFLRETFARIFMMEEDYTLICLVFTLALLNRRAGGFPEGGSLPFSQAIEQRFIELSGKLFYKSRVDKILEEDGRAVGLRLESGKEVRGDYVISAADLRTTLYHMLDGRHLDAQHVQLFETVKIAESSVQVSFGVRKDLSSPPASVGEFWQTGPIAGHKVDWIMFRNLSFDPTLAPPGKAIAECIFSLEDFSWWEKLSADKKVYNEEKQLIAAAVAEEINRRIPGFKAAIEATDVVTPMTYVRYTGNWKGAYMTWVLPPDKIKKFQNIKKTVPGLANFWLSGMWVFPPGGVPTGAMASREVLQLICHQDKQKFVTSLP